ncbi:MAG: hypothetical protein J6Y37_05745 [Paludibacteraceae bacterium]|nr:hypothetical protein [Paludibacteraceae bacterium]
MPDFTRGFLHGASFAITVDACL